MSGHPHWRGQDSIGSGRSGFGSRRVAPPHGSGTQSRRGMVAFALALTMAVGTVLVMIVASSVEAMAEAAAFSDPKSDSWVGVAAVGSVLVCALVGMVIVHRYTSTRQR